MITIQVFFIRLQFQKNQIKIFLILKSINLKIFELLQNIIYNIIVGNKNIYHFYVPSNFKFNQLNVKIIVKQN